MRTRTARIARPNRIAALILFAAVVALGACSSGSTPTATAPGNGAAANANGNANVGGADSGAPAGGEKAGGGEAPSIAFTHPSLKYSIDAPGTMTASADGSSYKGTSDFLDVKVLTTASSPTALAQADAQGSGVSGFQLLAGAHDVTINGLKGSALEFKEAAGTNAVTGKAQIAHVLRVYLPRAGGAYMIEYGSTQSDANWDPQGSMDIMLTFKAAP